MRMGFIGAGVVGTAMGKILKGKGFEIVGYCSRSQKSAERAAEVTGSRWFKDPADLASRCQLLFITTPDSAIRETAEKLAKKGAFFKGQVVAHMSGSLKADVLSPARDFGAFVLSIHPIQSCADVEQGIKNLSRSVFSLEGDREGIEVGRRIVEALGGRYFILSGEDKALYHAALCMVSNYLVALFSIGSQILLAAEMDKTLFAEAILPLMEGTLENLRHLKPSAALTGPIARGDAETVEAHLRALKAKVPQYLEVYRLLGLEALKLSREKGNISPERINVISNLLKEKSKDERIKEGGGGLG
ncbi:MAG: NADP oxidoreductase, coenzyme F420-dependent [Clostridia bacterium 41_269]|nr:MAG: NADP oxidoreductase, coenzyme F420-dependent [Clostridia bacterium 41_269]